jgi:hypothetical protein
MVRICPYDHHSYLPVHCHDTPFAFVCICPTDPPFVMTTGVSIRFVSLRRRPHDILRCERWVSCRRYRWSPTAASTLLVRVVAVNSLATINVYGLTPSGSSVTLTSTVPIATGNGFSCLPSDADPAGAIVRCVGFAGTAGKSYGIAVSGDYPSIINYTISWGVGGTFSPTALHYSDHVSCSVIHTVFDASSCGTVRWCVVVVVPPANDELSSKTTIPIASGARAGTLPAVNISYATFNTGAGESASSAYDTSVYYGSVWYKFVAPASG